MDLYPGVGQWYRPMSQVIASEAIVGISPGLPTIEIMASPVLLTTRENMKCDESVAVVCPAAKFFKKIDGLEEQSNVFLSRKFFKKKIGLLAQPF